MATINTVHDLLRLLDDNPEWTDALRARLLTQDLLELPERFSRFVTEMTDFRAEVNRFVEATNTRFDVIEREMTDFRTEVSRFIRATDRRLEALELGTKMVRRDIAPLRGGHARTTAIRQAGIIARLMGFRRVRNLTADDLMDLIDSSDTSDIRSNLLLSFAKADLVMEATDHDGDSCYIATEVSFTVHDRDISRASRNSRFLTRFTGRSAFAAVAGEHVHEDVQDVVDLGEVFWYRFDRDDLEVE